MFAVAGLPKGRRTRPLLSERFGAPSGKFAVRETVTCHDQFLENILFRIMLLPSIFGSNAGALVSACGRRQAARNRFPYGNR